MTTDKQRFGLALKKARSKTDLPQSAVADKIGIKESALSRYERGDVLPSVAIAASLAGVLGVSLDELAGINNMGKDNALISEVCNIISAWEDNKIKALITVLQK